MLLLKSIYFNTITHLSPVIAVSAAAIACFPQHRRGTLRIENSVEMPMRLRHDHKSNRRRINSQSRRLRNSTNRSLPQCKNLEFLFRLANCAVVTTSGRCTAVLQSLQRNSMAGFGVRPDAPDWRSRLWHAVSHRQYRYR